MKTIWTRLKAMKLGSNTLELLLWVGFGVVMFYVLMFVLDPHGPGAVFPAQFLHTMIGIGILLYMDRIHHSKIDTIRAIKENNVAYALVILAYAVIIAAVITRI